MPVSFLLDTDTCVYWLRGHETVRSRLSSAGPESIAISVVTLAELRYGAECSSRPESNHQAVDDLVSAISVLPMDAEIAGVFAAAKAELRRKGMLIEDLDLMIAATARVHGLTLVTNNESHFGRLPDLLLENWTEPY